VLPGCWWGDLASWPLGRQSLSEDHDDRRQREQRTDHNHDSPSLTDWSLSSCENHYASICEHCCRKYEPRYALGPGHYEHPEPK
jgi:hypothetical protein